MIAIPAPENLDLAALSMVRDGILRHSQMQYAKLRETYKEDQFGVLCGLPDPEGGSRPYGREADKALYGLIERLLKREPDLAARCSFDCCLLYYKKYLLKRLHRIEGGNGKAFPEHYAKAMVRLLYRSFRARTHFLPCVIPESPKLREVQIGPVLFTRTSDWLAKNEGGLKKALETLGDKHTDDLIREIAQSRWLGVVTVNPCDQSISSQRARRAVRAAIDVLRLFVGQDTAGKTGLSAERAKPFKSAALVQANGNFQITYSTSWGPVVPEAWLDFLNAPDRLRDSMGKAIHYVISDFCENPVRDRFLDALTWYGEACTEDNPNTAIIKAVACLERLTVFKQDENLTETVSSRTAALIANYTDKDFSHLRDAARKLYAVRSDLMHGRVGPHHENELISARYAAEIARKALIGYVRFLAILVQPVIESALRGHYQKAVLHFNPKAEKPMGKKQKKPA